LVRQTTTLSGHDVIVRSRHENQRASGRRDGLAVRVGLLGRIDGPGPLLDMVPSASLGAGVV